MQSKTDNLWEPCQERIPYEGPCPVDGGGVGHKTFACDNLYVLLISFHVFSPVHSN